VTAMAPTRKKRKQGDPRLSVAYLRVSTDEQANGLSAQRAAIESWAERERVEVLSWHEDHVSGATPVEDRLALMEALKEVGERGAGVLVSAKRDRLARDVVIAAAIETLAQGVGAQVVTADGVSADQTPEGSLLRTLLDAFAQYERAVIRARTRAALAAKRERGERTTGHAPWGSSWLNGKLVPAPEEVALLKRIKELKSKGQGVSSIVKMLDREDTRFRGRKVHETTLRRILARQ